MAVPSKAVTTADDDDDEEEEDILEKEVHVAKEEDDEEYPLFVEALGCAPPSSSSSSSSPSSSIPPAYGVYLRSAMRSSNDSATAGVLFAGVVGRSFFLSPTGTNAAERFSFHSSRSSCSELNTTAFLSGETYKNTQSYVKKC